MEAHVWYYRIDGEKKGPVSHKELQAMLDKGEVDASTEVWTDSNHEWVPILETEHFNMSTLDETPTEVVKKPVSYPRETDDAAALPRPWVRLFARAIDYSLLMLLSALVFGLNFLHPIPYIFIFFVWIFIESILLSTWGTTPGKWLLKVRLRSQEGKRLSFRDSLSRSFSVWWLGMGVGIPIVMFITMLVASVKLNNTGMTTWDRRFNYRVTHRKIGMLRILVTIAYFILFSWVINLP